MSIESETCFENNKSLKGYTMFKKLCKACLCLQKWFVFKCEKKNLNDSSYTAHLIHCANDWCIKEMKDVYRVFC